MKIKRDNPRNLEAAIDAVAKWLMNPKRLAAKIDARTGKPPSDFDDDVEYFLLWWHGKWGRKLRAPYSLKQRYRGSQFEAQDINFLAMRILGPVIEALANGDGKKLLKLGQAVNRVNKRCSGRGKTFRIEPAKPHKLKALEVADQGGQSAEDIYQAVARAFPNDPRIPTERHLRRLAVDLQIPPANKGGYRTRRP